MKVLIFVILASILLLSEAAPKRKSRELEDKINKLDEGTKKRIFAMKASGIPNSAIAEKITYEAGGKTNAKRIVDAIQDGPRPKTQPELSQKSQTIKKKTPNTNKSPLKDDISNPSPKKASTNKASTTKASKTKASTTKASAAKASKASTAKSSSNSNKKSQNIKSNVKAQKGTPKVNNSKKRNTQSAKSKVKNTQPMHK